MLNDHDFVDFEEFALALIERARGPIKINQPGTVVSYDADTQTAMIQPSLRVKVVDYDADTFEWKRSRPVRNVPIVFPAGGGFYDTWPLAPGDPVTILFCDRDLGPWRNSGAGDSTPQSETRFRPADMFAIPGGLAPSQPMPDGATADNARVFYGPTFLFRESGAVAKALAIAEDVRAELNAFKAAFRRHEHPLPLLFDSVTGAPITATDPGLPLPDPLPPSGSAGSTSTVITDTALADIASTRVGVDQ